MSSVFDYLEFGYCAGDFDQLVLHAHKYSREQAAELFNTRYAHRGLMCSIEDVQSGYVRYFIRPNQFMSQDYDGGCYSFVDRPGRGAFPVWVITLSDLSLASAPCRPGS